MTSRTPSIVALVSMLVLLAACSGKAPATTSTIHSVAPSAKATTSPPPAQTPEPATTRPVATNVPVPAASSSARVLEGTPPSPLIFRPSEAPTPAPSGHASPLPPNQFPADPSPTTNAQTTPTPTPQPAPVVVPTAGIPASMQLLDNNLPFGSGSVGGAVLGLSDTGTGSQVIGGGKVRIVLKSDTSKQASLIVGADGVYRVGSLALTTYLVVVTRDGYVGDTAPTEVTLSIGSNQNSNTPLVLVKSVPLPSS